MTLACEITGQGPDVVLVHGWGLHGGIWQPLAEQLRARFRVHCFDLPGHGASGAQPMPEGGIERLAQQLLAQAPTQAVWIGWSLGGMAAMAAAHAAPSAVRKLVLIGTTPRFVAGGDWPHGLAPQVFGQFAADLERDWRATLARFLSLQIGTDDDARELLRALRTRMFARGEPSLPALRRGLDWLHDTDLRAQLAALDMPALVVHGSRDRLAPPAAGEYLAAQLPRAEFELIAGAGHAPFLSHSAQVAERVMAFLV